MSHDLSLAQSHAFQLAQTLMVPVIVFRSNGAFGVLPSAELDDGEVETIAEFDQFESWPARGAGLLLTEMLLASCGGKGSWRRCRALASLALRSVLKALREVPK